MLDYSKGKVSTPTPTTLNFIISSTYEKYSSAEVLTIKRPVDSSIRLEIFPTLESTHGPHSGRHTLHGSSALKLSIMYLRVSAIRKV